MLARNLPCVPLHRPVSAKLGQTSINIGPELTTVGPNSAGFDRHRPGFDTRVALEWSNIGPHSARCGPARFDQHRLGFGQTLPGIDQRWHEHSQAKLGPRSGPGIAPLGPRHWQTLARNRTGSTKIGQAPTKSSPESTNRAGPGQRPNWAWIRSGVARNRTKAGPNAAKLGANSTKLGTDSGQCRTGIAQVRPTSARLRSTLARNRPWPEIGRGRPELAGIRSALPRNRPTSARILAGCGPESTILARHRPKFAGTRPKLARNRPGVRRRPADDWISALARHRREANSGGARARPGSTKSGQATIKLGPHTAKVGPYLATWPDVGKMRATQEAE